MRTNPSPAILPSGGLSPSLSLISFLSFEAIFPVASPLQ
jgi:hypothetical protein